MAVLEYRQNGKVVAVKHFEVPKRASDLKEWYRAAQRACKYMPLLEPYFLVDAKIDTETIFLTWKGENGIMHDVTIARKRRLL